MVQGGQLRVLDGGREPGATGPGAGQDPDEKKKAAAVPPVLPVIPPPSIAALWLIPAALVSLLLHGGLLVIALKAPQLIAEREDSIVQMFVVETPPEVEEIKEVEPEPEEPEPETPEPEVVDYQDAVVAEAPPADAQPVEEQPTAPVFGVSMSSTVSGGSSWGLQVGNTVAIKPEDSAPATDATLDTPVVAYQFIEREPVVVKRFEPPYPDGPKQAGIEGDVLLYLTIDAEGNVTSAKVVRGPHPELNEAARKAMFKHRFRPAMKGGRSVIVERFPYQFTWIIEE